VDGSLERPEGWLDPRVCALRSGGAGVRVWIRPLCTVHTSCRHALTVPGKRVRNEVTANPASARRTSTPSAALRVLITPSRSWNRRRECSERSGSLPGAWAGAEDAAGMSMRERRSSAGRVKGEEERGGPSAHAARGSARLGHDGVPLGGLVPEMASRVRNWKGSVRGHLGLNRTDSTCSAEEEFGGHSSNTTHRYNPIRGHSSNTTHRYNPLRGHSSNTTHHYNPVRGHSSNTTLCYKGSVAQPSNPSVNSDGTTIGHHTAQLGFEPVIERSAASEPSECDEGAMGEKRRVSVTPGGSGET
ncbi:hypothetical protein P4O66_022099, partial [Electrophorus voltai]